MLRSLIIVLFLAATPYPAGAQSREQICPEGYEALHQNTPERAQSAFEACLAEKFYDWPQEAELRTRLGAAQLALGEGAQALLTYNQIFALIEAHGGDMNHPLLLRNRAAAYLQLDRPEDAVTDLQTARQRSPNDAFSAALAGSAYLELDRSEEAVAAFDTALRLETDYLMAWIGRSAAFTRLDMHHRAIADATEAVALAPEDPGALNVLCWSLVQAERAMDGLSTCRQASNAAPNNGSITHSLAAALEQIGDLETAYQLYERAADQSPEDPEVLADYQRTRGPNP